MAKTTRSTALRVLLLIGGVPAILGQLTLQELFPYGPTEGDAVVPTADDNFVGYSLTAGATFYFFNNTYTSLFVNNNGGVSFNAGVSQFTPTCGALSSPMIIPYWADIDTRNGGFVYYRESRDPTLLAKAQTEVATAFPTLRVNPVWLFIVTWADCAFFGAQAPTATCVGTSARNTFQLVLVSDGTKSFDIFNYNQVTWTTGTASGGDCNGVGGTPAKAGFDVGDGSTFFSIDGSCDPAIMGVTSTTNVNRPGQWIFRIDGALEEPEPVTEPEPTTEAATEPTTTEAEPEPEPTTTEEPTTTMTPEPTTSQPAPAPECTAHSCLHTGHCFSYSVCDHPRGVWVSQNCSVGLFWNPNHSGAQTLEECYGSCDLWDNLSPETQATYAADASCFPDQCFYEAVSECGTEYMYHSNSTDIRGPAATLRCPLDTREGMNVSLVWVQDRETCDFCYNAVNRETGEPCCERYAPHIPDPTTPTTTMGPSTTGFPTTEQPTTGFTTTGPSTTGMPTTGPSTTGVPTTESPTTGPSTTGVPTTSIGPDPTTTDSSASGPPLSSTVGEIVEATTAHWATTGAPMPEASTIMLPGTAAAPPAGRGRKSHIHVVRGKGLNAKRV